MAKAKRQAKARGAAANAAPAKEEKVDKTDEVEEKPVSEEETADEMQEVAQPRRSSRARSSAGKVPEVTNEKPLNAAAHAMQAKSPRATPSPRKASTPSPLKRSDANSDSTSDASATPTKRRKTLAIQKLEDTTPEYLDRMKSFFENEVDSFEVPVDFA